MRQVGQLDNGKRSFYSQMRTTVLPGWFVGMAALENALSTGSEKAAAIISAAETLFDQNGFAETGMDAIRDVAGASLKTIYKYYPSRDLLIGAVLQHRHDRYLEDLSNTIPGDGGPDVVLHIFDHLDEWFERHGARGCLFFRALSAYPQSEPVKNAVVDFKNRYRASIRRIVSRAGMEPVEDIAQVLFVLAEGATASAATLGTEKAVACAQAAARSFIEDICTTARA